MENSFQTRSQKNSKSVRAIRHSPDVSPVIEQERLVNSRTERYGSNSGKKQKKSANSLKMFLVIICIGVFSLCAIVTVGYLMDGYQSAHLVQTIREQIPAAAPAQQSGQSVSAQPAASGLAADASMKEYQSLLAINPEAAGWITIPGMNIDYPMARAKDNAYYQTHDFDRKESERGCIFMDYRNDGMSPGSHILIYGHNMRDGSMFGQLTQYKTASFYQAHPVINLNLYGKATTWQIFSATVVNDDALPADIESQAGLSGFIQSMKSGSLYDTGVTAGPDDQILTLSTCPHEYKNASFTVHAKRIGTAN
jgi:sortase, SrtB family